MNPANLTPEQIRALQELLAGATSTLPTFTLAQAVSRYEAEKLVPGVLKPGTIRAYRRGCKVLGERWGEVPVASDEWPRLAGEMFGERGQTAHLYLNVLRALLTASIAWGWRTKPHGLDAVLKRCKYLPREVAYTAEQIQALLNALAELDRTAPKQHGARDVVRVLALTGCRLMEIAALRCTEVQPGHLRLKDSKTGARRVFLPRQAEIVIRQQFWRHGWVFPSKIKGKHLAPNTVQHAFHEAREKAKIREGSVHTLRHSWASIAARSGVPSAYAQEQLGHSSSWMTRLYTHARPDDVALSVAVVESHVMNGVTR